MAHATMIPTMLSAEQTFWEANYWDAIQTRDARMDGAFYYGVVSTGVYCRPSCRSRMPKRENVLFFEKRERAEREGFRACLRCHPEKTTGPNPRVEMIRNACRHIEQHLDEPLTLAALGAELGVSPFHLQRTFKEIAGVTPRAYADGCRLNTLKTGLKAGRSVTTAMYDAGYGSSSRLYERAGSQLGMTPATYRKGGAGAAIRFATAASPIGRLLVAITERGLCWVQLGASDAELESALTREYPSASIERDTADSAHIRTILDHLNGHPLEADLPLDIRATAFQRRVWEHLKSIPYGKTESYAEVAAAIGQPRAARAVARACASNPVALAIPCHRVIRGNGAAGGYRWGLERKKALLDRERS
jgi:AraC family transcriptional regulator of adaptative response/methylated-DNA-[protein]-cysteine methyltransferase